MGPTVLRDKTPIALVGLQVRRIPRELIRAVRRDGLTATLRRISERRLASLPEYERRVRGARGLEIGGPSQIFTRRGALPIYQAVGSLDNCVFSRETVWSSASDAYRFDPKCPSGRTIIAEGADLGCIRDGSYDFVAASHALEHFANPVRALREWRRVTRPGGALVLVLPDPSRTFDHWRPITTLDHMLDDYSRNVGEDDLTHLPEILALHDLSKDPAAGDPQAFEERSKRNAENRCLHHHVFSSDTAAALIQSIPLVIERVDIAPPHHIVLLATRA